MPYTGDVPVYRLLNGGVGGNNGHFYTTDCNEAQTLVRQNWNYEGVQCYLSSAGAPGLVPLYRLSGVGMHFYTADETEKNNAVAAGWTLEGAMGYVSTTQTADTGPLYRALDPLNTDHFYTTNQAEWNNAVAAGWTAEGITGYVSPNYTLNCAALQQALKDVLSDAAHIQAYVDCMNAQGFDMVGFLEMASAIAGGDGPAIAQQVAQIALDGAKNGQGCAAMLTQAQRNTLANNQWLYDRAHGKMQNGRWIV